jgi:DNA excision repair protein ERCC-5
MDSDMVESSMSDPVVSSFVEQNRIKDEEQPINLSFDPIQYMPVKGKAIGVPLQVISIEEEDSSDSAKSIYEQSSEKQTLLKATDIIATPKPQEPKAQLFEDKIDLTLEDDGIVEELIPAKYTDRDNSKLIEQLQSEISALNDSAQPASSSSPDSELFAEFRTMLTIMGIPWINAPGEAEAQCAHLQLIGHVDGVITDDNDVLLFGATKVYRHFFNNSKRIMRFGVKEIERDLSLDRTELAILAVLLGGDYGTGVRGMGPVKSMQLLKILRPIVETAELLTVIAAGLVDGVWPTINEESCAFLQKLSIQCAVTDRRLFDPEILDAYYNPLVDETPPTFRWSLLPDITRLTEFLQAKLRWDPIEVKRTIDPIIMRRTRKK